MGEAGAEFSAIIDRKPLKLPGGARVAVWVAVNVEDWDINEKMARTLLPYPQGVTVIPDVVNYGWFDYGLRVGIWRIMDVLERAGIRGTTSLNASGRRLYWSVGMFCFTYRNFSISSSSMFNFLFILTNPLR